ncbi:MAG: HlyD family efflux transporter periplasmic adaptor subunit [Syntrophomonadaceae bacterium]|nr:HlyD family efflux transporter periplasmic adaptor subunit [Syntrophomonadaceae bacterium]
MKRISIAVLLGIVTLSIVIFGFYFNRQQEALTVERESLSVIGTIEARTAMAAFKVPGRLETLWVDEGAAVETGQVLAVLESRELEAKLNQARGAWVAAQAQVQQAENSIPLTSQQVEAAIAQAQAKVEQAEVGVRDAQLNLERAVALFKNGTIPQKSLDDAENNYVLAQKKLQEARSGLEQAESARLKVNVAQSQREMAQGQYRQAEGAMQEAEAYVENTKLHCPMSGYITQKFLEAGEMLNAGTPVFEITDLKNTYVKVYISEKKIGRVHLNQVAEVRIDAFPQTVFKGQVVRIKDAGDFAVRKAISEQYAHDLRSFEVKVAVPNPDLVLKTGMTARVQILEGE